MLGFLPPPIYGPAVTYAALLQSPFVQRFDVTFINLSVVRDYRELERFRVSKLMRLVRQLTQMLSRLLLERFDFVFYPLSFNRQAFLKDVVFLSLARLFGVPIVLYGHGNGLPEFRTQSPGWLRWLIDRSVRWAIAAVVPGEALRRNFLGHLRPEQVFAVTNGVPVPAELPQVHKRADRCTVLYLGNLVREKGVFVILQAIPAVLRRCPHAHFVFAGAWWRDSDREEAQRWIAEQGLQEHVEFCGSVTGRRKWEIVAQSDLLVFPTYYAYETLGQVLLEAMGVGLPVITTRRAAIPEIVEEGVNGLFVAEQDAADLAAKIIRLINDPATRQRMGAANRQKYAAHYTVERYGERMAAVFEELARRHCIHHSA